MSTDRIEKTVVLRAPRERVWRAVSDAREFGLWFGVRFDAPFVEGELATGAIVPTAMDPEVARLQKPHEGKRLELFVERIEPPNRITFRWHPFAVDPKHDFSNEPMTRIVFELSAVEGGTRLTITESGFENVPLARRLEAFRANEGGWELQAKLIGRYVAS